MLTSGMFGYLADYALWWLVLISVVVHTWCFFQFFPRRRYRRLGLLIGNLLVFVCMIGSVAMVGESYFRFLCVETDPFGWSVPAQRWFALYTRLNSSGCRDEEWTAEKPEGVRRIAFVGDSFTYGWGIERVEDRFTDRLQTRFRERSAGRDRAGDDTVTRMEVMNVAKPGWDSGAQLAPVRDMIAHFAVDEVVLCYVANDIEELLPVSDDFNPIHPPQPRWFNPDSSCLLEYLHRRVQLPRAPTVRGYHDWLADGFADADIRRRHQLQLEAIMRHCREQGVTLRVVLFPFLRVSGNKFDAESVHDSLRRFFETGDVNVLDLLTTLAGANSADLMVNSHDAHPNEQANELFADAIWQAFYTDSGR